MGVMLLYLFKVCVSFVMYIYLSILYFIWCHYILEREESDRKSEGGERLSSWHFGTDTEGVREKYQAELYS